MLVIIVCTRSSGLLSAAFDWRLFWYNGHAVLGCTAIPVHCSIAV